MFQVNSNIVLPTLVDVHQAEVGGLAVFSSLSPPPATFGPVMIRAVQNLQPFHETDFQVEPAPVSEYAELNFLKMLLYYKSFHRPSIWMVFFLFQHFYIYAYIKSCIMHWS